MGPGKSCCLESMNVFWPFLTTKNFLAMVFIDFPQLWALYYMLQFLCDNHSFLFCFVFDGFWWHEICLTLESLTVMATQDWKFRKKVRVAVKTMIHSSCGTQLFFQNLWLWQWKVAFVSHLPPKQLQPSHLKFFVATRSLMTASEVGNAVTTRMAVVGPWGRKMWWKRGCFRRSLGQVWKLWELQ